jgi:hypothetical protein
MERRVKRRAQGRRERSSPAQGLDPKLAHHGDIDNRKPTAPIDSSVGAAFASGPHEASARGAPRVAPAWSIGPQTVHKRFELSEHDGTHLQSPRPRRRVLGIHPPNRKAAP